MFDDFVDDLKQLDGMIFRIPIGLDIDGYIDRQCHGTECGFLYKVHDEDWNKIVKHGHAFCPLCGRESPSSDFDVPIHIQMAEDQAWRHVQNIFGDMISSVSNGYQRNHLPAKIVITLNNEAELTTLPALEEIHLKITCEECGCRFAVIGSAYFCPACGHSAAVRVFADSMTKIEAKITHLDKIHDAVAEVDKDQAELVRRSLLETGLSDGVVALQRVFDQLYSHQPGAVTPLPFNVFQRIDDGSNLWKDLIGKGYDDFLTPDELDQLKVLFQRRHKLSHTDGIVDQKYIDKSGDTTYTVGQRIIVNKQDVLDMVAIIRKLVSGYLRELGFNG